MSAAEGHAVLAASGAHRWLNCPPSARLEEAFPDTSSPYAAEGRMAHTAAELRLHRRFRGLGEAEYRTKLEALMPDASYAPEMDGFIGMYEDCVARIAGSFASPPYVAVERCVDYSAWVSGGFGTVDCILLHGPEMHICDFKYGKGVPVSAERNPQMMLYALGVFTTYGFLYGFKTVRLAIVQPRLDRVSEWRTTLPELIAWGESIKPAARLAWEGGGEYAAGEWCRFCRASRTCRARMDHYLSLELWRNALPPTIDNSEVGEILERAAGLASWAGCLKAYALSECLAGRDVKGWKAVEGRAARTISDFDSAVAAFAAAGYDPSLFYRRSHISMTEMEKIVGRGRFEELAASYVTAPPGKPALAPASDPRSPITRNSLKDEYATVESEE